MQQYFSDNQIRRFLLQFTRLFSNFQCEYGKDENGATALIRVPIRYGDATRQSQSILQDNSANSMPCAPLMTFNINSLKYDRRAVQEPYFVSKQQVKQRKFNTDTQTYAEQQGNAFQVEKLMPSPYKLGLTLDIWTTSTQMKMQLLEQILPLFNPSMEIQSTDNYLDWTSLSAIELMDTNWSSRSVPNNNDSIDIATLKFEMPIWISVPARVTKQGVIHKIIANIYDNQGDLALALQNDDILQGTRIKVTPIDQQVLLIGNELQLLNPQSPISISKKSNLEPLEKRISKAQWKPTVDRYGVLRNGITQILLTKPDGTDIVGTVSYHPTDDNLLVFTVDTDTLPTNTLPPITAVINPLRNGPSIGLLPATTGQRYLLTDDIGAITDNELALAWSGTSNIEVVAIANDVIEFNGVNWEVVFNSKIGSTNLEYISNLTSTLQYKWENNQWVKSYEGIYESGDWSIQL